MISEVLVNNSPAMNGTSFEVVERKGLGHPDTICDLVAERVSYDLGHYYLKTCGRVLHYNVDKALLVGGTSKPRFGGGELVEFPKFYMGDRAVAFFDGRNLGIDNVIQASINSWLNENLRFLRLGENLVWKNEIRQGSATLNSVEDRGVSNDTSAGVGYWPLSDLEEITLSVEQYMNSPAFKAQHPVAGEDIKVMSMRRGEDIEIVLACAMVGKFITDVSDYTEKKASIVSDVKNFLSEKYSDQFRFSLALNTLDESSQGQDGLYLTVTGLSCENGDSGQVGRGNRVSGLISFMRPQSMEAWAGKNFKTHVGKIYNFAAQSLARIITENVPEISEATVTLVGKIGFPVNKPPYIYTDIKTKAAHDSKIREKVLAVLKAEIDTGTVFQPEFLFSELPTTVKDKKEKRL